jgi:hypothetical protein
MINYIVLHTKTNKKTVPWQTTIKRMHGEGTGLNKNIRSGVRKILG